MGDGEENTDGPPRHVQLAFFGLIVVNIFPLVGVFVAGWSVGALLLLYWFETAIVGLTTAVQMRFAGGPLEDADTTQSAAVIDASSRRRSRNRREAGGFLLQHFGFWVAHGLVLWLFFLVSEWTAVTASLESWFWLALGAFTLNYLFTTGHEYVFLGTYRTAVPDDVIGYAYRRLWFMHLVVTLGVVFVVLLHSTLPGLIVLVLLKLGADLREFVIEHRPERRPQSA
ncbi:DUF6498-containing protein [Natrialbaceae archaeon A-CW2]